MKTQDESNKPKEPQLLFRIEDVKGRFGNMPESTIRRYIKKGTLKYCEHLGSRPYYFTQKHLDDFVSLLSGGDK